jgi:hypothetical protein
VEVSEWVRGEEGKAGYFRLGRVCSGWLVLTGSCGV